MATVTASMATPTAGARSVGEMATYAALATAIAARVPRLALVIGPLAISVRSPVAMALGRSSVALLTAARVGLALGAAAGADDLALVPSTAEDPAGAATLTALVGGAR